MSSQQVPGQPFSEQPVPQPPGAQPVSRQIPQIDPDGQNDGSGWRPAALPRPDMQMPPARRVAPAPATGPIASQPMMSANGGQPPYQPQQPHQPQQQMPQPHQPQQQQMPQPQQPPQAASQRRVSEPARPDTPRLATPPGRDRLGMQSSQVGDLDLDAAALEARRLGGSDLHLTDGVPPMVRVAGQLHPLDQFEVLAPEPLRRVLYSILTQQQREKFESELELDFSYTVRNVGRFRVNLYQQRESIGAAFRLIPEEIKPLSDLGMPKSVSTFAGLPRGLVLVTGPTGSGKSTTLASIIDLANQTRADHIMTVEDPIEFLHRHKRCLVNQREVGADTLSFGNALKHALRQDPDIILVGELRDLETMSVALTAAETGHLVFATLHTQDAAQTVDRFVDVFPSGQQSQVRTQLASAIQGVVCQTLCKRANGVGRVVATEVMVATPAIRNLIREGKTHQIYSAMQAGAELGMHTMDQQLAELVRAGRITYEVGLEKAHHVEDYNKMTGRDTRIAQGSVPLQDSAAGRLGGR